VTGRGLVTFALGGVEFGLDAAEVEEVVHEQPVTPVPLAARAVSGLIHLRGRIIPVVDLRRCLELEERPAAALPRLMVLRTPDGPLGLEVDRLLDVVDAADARFEPPPDTLGAATRELIEATCTLRDRLVLVLDLEHVIALTGARGPARAADQPREVVAA
jgi:purine-binding chemotaxis protein CheW